MEYRFTYLFLKNEITKSFFEIHFLIKFGSRLVWNACRTVHNIWFMYDWLYFDLRLLRKPRYAIRIYSMAATAAILYILRKWMAQCLILFFFTRCVFSDIIRLNNLIFQVICRFRHLNSNIISFAMIFFTLNFTKISDVIFGI